MGRYIVLTATRQSQWPTYERKSQAELLLSSLPCAYHSAIFPVFVIWCPSARMSPMSVVQDDRIAFRALRGSPATTRTIGDGRAKINHIHYEIDDFSWAHTTTRHKMDLSCHMSSRSSRVITASKQHVTAGMTCTTISAPHRTRRPP